MRIVKNTVGCFDKDGKCWQLVEITTGKAVLQPINMPAIKLTISRQSYEKDYWKEKKPLII